MSAFTISSDGELITKETADEIKGWIVNKDQPPKYYIGVDIGGTHTRVALRVGDKEKTVSKFKAKSTRDILQALRHLEHTIVFDWFHGEPSSGAAIAGAGRILGAGSLLEITNFPGSSLHRELLLSELPLGLFPGGTCSSLSSPSSPPSSSLLSSC